MYTAEGLVVAWSLAVLVADLSTRRIPNELSLGAVIVGVGFLLVTGHALLGVEWVAVLIGGALALLLTLPGYLSHLLGAGDVKVLFALGMLGGWHMVLFSFAVAGLLGGLIIFALLLRARMTGYPLPERRWFPFGAALALGSVVAVLLEV